MYNQLESIAVVSAAAITLSRACGERAAHQAQNSSEIMGQILARAIPKALIVPEDMERTLGRVK